MHPHINNTFTKEKVIVLIVTIFVLGLVGYIKFTEQRLSSIKAEINNKNTQIAEMNEYIKTNTRDLQGNFLSIAEGLAGVLEREQQGSDALNKEIRNLKTTVSMLKKLSKSDPELLKKYSKAYFLNEHYVPISLAEIPGEYRNTRSTNFQIHSDVLPYLTDLIDDANKNNLELQVLSGYRSFSTQSSLKATYSFIYGAGTANRFSADQGYSEHQLGTTVDFTTKKTLGSLEGFENTEEYKWLLENAHRYGFVISYPAGNAYYKFEPWHWRFVGTDLASRLYNDKVYFYDMDQRDIDTYLAFIFD